MNLLIVDDLEENICLLKRVLKRYGFTNIFSATSASHAFKILETESIQLIYLDIIMPVMDGITVCKEIKKNKSWQDIPIIMITANDESELIKEAFFAGATDYVRKPFDVVELMARTNVALKMQQEIDARKKRDNQFYQELNLARSLQRSVLTPLIQNNDLEMNVFYEPSESVGGDMYCVYEINDGEYGILLYDVMGHGVPSALVSMSLYSLTRGLITRMKDPAIVIEELNSHMHRLFYQNPNISGYFVTAIYAYLNTKTKEVHYVNAGHPEGLAFFGEEVIALSSTSPFLGVLPEIPIGCRRFSYNDELKLFFYTDGLMDHIQLGKKLAIDEIKEIALVEKKDIVEYFVQKYDLETGHKEDDICLLSLTVKKRSC